MKNAEFCLFGTKGAMSKYKIANNIYQVIEHDRTTHSTKPQIFRDKIIELFGNISRIELFARQLVEGWDAWGNEIEESPVLGEESPAQNTKEICHTAPNRGKQK